MDHRIPKQSARAPDPGKASCDASISIIVPMLNEACALTDRLAGLQTVQRNGCEVLFVDGGSEDASVVMAERAGFTVVKSPRGRARQMNTGARAACGELLLFLHADTRLPAGAHALLREALSNGPRVWGFFKVRIEGRPRMLRVVSFLMNLRSRLTGIATGDQALFVRRSAFERVSGFPDQALMEDVELSRRLKRVTSPVCLRAFVTTSGRRWESRGVWRTIFLMWRLRLAYWLGAHPDRLARIYR
jgi:rSAM/selenodomain-associated transferase 2